MDEGNRVTGGQPDAPPGELSLAHLRAELRRVQAGIELIDAGLERLQHAVPAPPAASTDRSRPARYYAVLVGVYESGPHGVATERFAEIGASQGYDRRGLGGYFAGARAPLARSRGRVRLTTEGSRLVLEHLRRLAA